MTYSEVGRRSSLHSCSVARWTTAAGASFFLVWLKAPFWKELLLIRLQYVPQLIIVFISLRCFLNFPFRNAFLLQFLHHQLQEWIIVSRKSIFLNLQGLRLGH